MTHHTTQRFLLACVLAPALLLAFTSFAPAQDAAPQAAPAATMAFDKLVEQYLPSLVSIKYVVKVGEQQAEQTIDGTLIAKDMVIASHRNIGGVFGAAGSVSDIKVLIGDDTEGVEGKLIAQDSDLDLAWVQITGEVKGEVKPVTLDREAPLLKAGDALLSIGRLNDYFDRQPVVSEGRIGGLVNKPRQLYVPTSGLSTAAGLPVFAGDGTVVGIVVNARAESEEQTQQRVQQLAAQGRNVPATAVVQTIRLVLPVADVAKATARAQAAAAADAEE